jgi:hypothetical protein
LKPHRRKTAAASAPIVAALLAGLIPAPARAQTTADPQSTHTLVFRFIPTARTQIALWLEHQDGTFLKTVGLTQATSFRGIGNRPGASQMNSGFRWPYGRREGVLPVWAHRRAAAPGARPFPRVVFQHRPWEGCASNAGMCGGSDSTEDKYFCLSFKQATTRKEALDAVSCASVFSSDKGRYLLPGDVAGNYSEPAIIEGTPLMRPLGLTSLYPSRRDVVRCTPGGAGCEDHADVERYQADTRAVMPDIDAVTMATPPAESEHMVMFDIPPDWPLDAGYVAWIEIGSEGDHNDVWSATAYDTPKMPVEAWDGWAVDYGYPYRGQPSVVFSVPVSLAAPGTARTAVVAGYGSLEGFGPSGGALSPPDGRITDDPVAAPGSGADRLRLVSPRAHRFEVEVLDVALCRNGSAPAVPTSVTTAPFPDDKFTHQWGRLSFVVPPSERRVAKYEVKFSNKPIVEGDPQTFERALPAVAADIDTIALVVPTGGLPGDRVEVSFGGMDPLTHYWVAIRAVDACNMAGPYAVAEITTTRINYTQLSGCFVATAAFGSALAPRVEALRALRDAARPRSTLFAAATALYYDAGPAAAAVLGRSELARAVARTLLAPLADAAAAGTAAPLVRR